MKKTILILGLIVGIIFKMDAQIEGLKYLIEYNESTNLYDCKIVIIDGEATTYPQRIQSNSLYTIVVPTGTTLTIDSLYNPTESNQFYMGTIPCLWDFGPKEISPPITPMLDYHSVYANLSPPSAFNDLHTGDTITLFSVFADIDPCENEIRPFDNATDPSSIEMPSGGDYSNGYTLLEGGQVYCGNLLPNISISICYGECTSLIPNLSCLEGVLNFEWSTGDTTEVIEVCPSESTNYYLLVTDTLDMILDSLTFFVAVDSLELQLQDLEICANEMTVASSNVPGGTWVSANPLFATIDANTGIITANNLGGTCIFQYTTPNGCTANSEILVILPNPFELINNQIGACVGEVIAIYPNPLVGLWVSDNPDVATVHSSTGTITTISGGTAIITFTDSSTGCSSTIDLEVSDIPIVSFHGDSEICIGETTKVFPTVGGTWISDDTSIAQFTNAGIVTGISSGTTNLVFANSISGCSSESLLVTVLPATDPLCLVGIDDLESQNIKVYPNPAKDIINVEGILPIESISIYTTGYRKIKNLIFNDGMNNRQISIEDLKSGLYFIEIKSKGKIAYKKLIVE